MAKLLVYTDGGSRGNPGKAAIGSVIYLDGLKIKEIKKYIGITTNNVAEYQAVIETLLWINNNSNLNLDKIKQIEWRLDSKLVVEQLNKRWKIKDLRLKELANQVWSNLSNLKVKNSFTHIPREKNQLADSLVNQALDLNEQ